MSEIKAGELGIIVRSMAGNEGVIFTCLRVIDSFKFEELGFLRTVEIDRVLKSKQGRPVSHLPIAWVRPIRDTDGADEVNAIAQRKSGREVGV